MIEQDNPKVINTSSSDSTPKVFVIGLDGATLDLIQPWADQGLFPTFSKILSQGVWGRLESTIPPLTGTAWNSFMTGKNPGKHGIFDFIHRGQNDYQGVPINATMRDGNSLWSLISQAGKKVGVHSVPATYPPEKVNGYMVTGMLTPPGVTDYTYPLSLAKVIQENVPDFTLFPEGVAHALGRENELLNALDTMIEMDLETIRFLNNRYETDFFMTVLKETDIAMHWLWRFMDEDHPWSPQNTPTNLRQGLKTCYQRIDSCVAEILDIAGDDTIIVLMSDHGAGPLNEYIHVNTWLLKEGFMNLKPKLNTWTKHLLFSVGFTPASLYKTTMSLGRGKQIAGALKQHKIGIRSFLQKAFLSYDDVDWSRTRAYSLGNYGQLYINLRGREPLGIVSPDVEYEKVIDELIEGINQWQHPKTGKEIPVSIYRKEEIYHGAHLDDGPDLVFLPEDMRYNGFGLFNFSSNSWLESTFDRSGGHRMDGIIMFYGPGVRRGYEIQGSKIIDLAPTILAAMGIAIPEDMDGKVLSGAFEDDYFKEMPIRFTEGQSQKTLHQLTFTEEQEEQIKERLRGLGYIA